MRRKANENGYGKEIKGRGLEREERAADRRWRKDGKDMKHKPIPRPCLAQPKKTEGLT